MQATGTLVENNNAADSYCAEALGAVTGLLLIKAVMIKNYWYLKKLTRHCDNKGIVKHGKSANKAVPEKQVQVNLIALINKVVRVTLWYLGGTPPFLEKGGKHSRFCINLNIYS